MKTNTNYFSLSKVISLILLISLVLIFIAVIYFTVKEGKPIKKDNFLNASLPPYNTINNVRYIRIKNCFQSKNPANTINVVRLGEYEEDIKPYNPNQIKTIKITNTNNLAEYSFNNSLTLFGLFIYDENGNNIITNENVKNFKSSMSTIFDDNINIKSENMFNKALELKTDISFDGTLNNTISKNSGVVGDNNWQSLNNGIYKYMVKTKMNTQTGWWECDLGKPYNISCIQLANGTAQCCYLNMMNLTLEMRSDSVDSSNSSNTSNQFTNSLIIPDNSVLLYRWNLNDSDDLTVGNGVEDYYYNTIRSFISSEKKAKTTTTIPIASITSSTTTSLTTTTQSTNSSTSQTSFTTIPQNTNNINNNNNINQNIPPLTFDQIKNGNQLSNLKLITENGFFSLKKSNSPQINIIQKNFEGSSSIFKPIIIK